MALMLSGEFLFAWSVAGIWLSSRTQRLPESRLLAAALVILFGPVIWFLAIGALMGEWVHKG